MIFNVVSTPTSDDTRTSSRLSSTSSSIVDLPTRALPSFEKKLSFVFSNPLSRVSFFSLENHPNITSLYFKVSRSYKRVRRLRYILRRNSNAFLQVSNKEKRSLSGDLFLKFFALAYFLASIS